MTHELADVNQKTRLLGSLAPATKVDQWFRASDYRKLGAAHDFFNTMRGQILKALTWYILLGNHNWKGWYPTSRLHVESHVWGLPSFKNLSYHPGGGFMHRMCPRKFGKHTAVRTCPLPRIITQTKSDSPRTQTDLFFLRGNAIGVFGLFGPPAFP